MSDHIDLFEKLCGQIASSGNPATEEEKLDWFIDSVNEDTYASSKAHCNSLKILDTLNFAQIIKLYALTCFAKYPQFQLRALGQKDATLTNNSNSFDKRGRKGKGKSDHGKGKGRASRPKNTGRGSHGKGAGNRPSKGRGKCGSKNHDESQSSTSMGQAQQLVQPRKERRPLNSKENATTVANAATNPANVAKDSRPKPKLITLEKQTTV